MHYNVPHGREASLSVRFGRWIVVSLWGISVVLMTGITLSYLLPIGDRMLTFSGPTYAIAVRGTIAVGGGLTIENGELAIKRIDLTKFAAANFGIPYLFRYVGFEGPGMMWHCDISLWCLLVFTTALAALGTVSLLRNRLGSAATMRFGLTDA
jgi:hypothetical protein